MRVMHITTIHPPFDTRIFYKEAKSLVKLGYEVMIVGAFGDEITATKEYPNITFYSIGEKPSRFKRIFNLPKLLKVALSQRAEIYHFHDPDFLLVGIILSLLKRNVVYDAHEYYSEALHDRTWIPKPLRKIAAKLFGSFELFACKFFSGVVTADYGQEERFFTANKRVVTLANLSPMPNVRWSGGKLPNRVFHVGGLSNDRGGAILCEAIEKMPEVEFVLMGTLPERYSSTSVLPSNVKYLGYLPASQIPEILANGGIGTACLLPTNQHEKGISTKIFEYIGLGLPICISDITPNKEFVKEYGIGKLYKATNADELARGLRWIFENDKWIEDQREISKEIFMKKFSWESQECLLTELYQSIVKLSN